MTTTDEKDRPRMTRRERLHALIGEHVGNFATLGDPEQGGAMVAVDTTSVEGRGPLTDERLEDIRQRATRGALPEWLRPIPGYEDLEDE